MADVRLQHYLGSGGGICDVRHGKARRRRKRYGFAKENKIKLYGQELELLSDPVNPQAEDIFVDAREERTNSVRQVQVPRNIVEMAKSGRRNRT